MFNDSQRAELLSVFLAESTDLLQRIEQSLSLLETEPQNPDAINELFRAVHTLKGSAGMLGLNLVSDFAHVFEDVLMRVRDREITLDLTLVGIAFKCMDHLAVLVESVAAGADTDPDPARRAKLMSELCPFQSLSESTVAPHPASGVEGNCRAQSVQAGKPNCWHISLRFPADLFHMGFDPASFLRYLSKLGEVEAVYAISDDLPVTLADFQPETCYLGLEIRFRTDVGREDIADVFEFISDVAGIEILAPESTMEDYIALIRALPENDERLGRLLVDCGAITALELEAALGLSAGADNTDQQEASPVEQTAEAGPVVSGSAPRQPLRKTAEAAFLRVATNKLDTLIDQVGELVIAAAGAQLLVGKRNDPELSQMCEDIQHHVENIRESALQLRMVEIGESFNRFHRVVRETSEALGKQIRLDIRGGETELDKTLVDKIHDPLVHLVRNAIDHGIESPEERKAAHKSPEGKVTLDAFYESGMIVIEVADDGRGIEVEKVRTKAIGAGIVGANEDWAERDLLELIFHPGLSTAGQVSSLSGRGVGMDSVRQDIDALRGNVEINNQPGQGCRMRIRLPLTLAIIDGFLVSVADQFFVIPTEWVVECIEAPRQQPGLHQKGYMDLRDKPLPVINLREHFAIAGDACRRQSLIVVSQGQGQAGLLVDALHGEIQTVIKPLGDLFESLSGITGGTILGSGQVALTLDVPGLLLSMRDNEVSPVRGSALNTVAGGLR